MFTLETVQNVLKDYYKERFIGEKIINIEVKSALILVETMNSFELVKVIDFTNEPVGAVDLLVIHRVQKSGDQLLDMSEMIYLLIDGLKNKINKHNDEIVKILSDIQLETQRLKDIF